MALAFVQVNNSAEQRHHKYAHCIHLQEEVKYLMSGFGAVVHAGVLPATAALCRADLQQLIKFIH